MNTFQYISEDWPKRIRYTNNSTRALWRELGRFGGRDGAERLFRRARGDKANIHKFSNSISMADAYFVAYEDADDSIDALLLYYGTMCLARAVILAEMPFDVVNSWIPGHGINAKLDLRAKLVFFDSKLDFGNERETFGLVNKAFGGDSLGGTTVGIRDVLSAIPDAKDYIELPFGVQSRPLEFEYTGLRYVYESKPTGDRAGIGGGGQILSATTGSLIDHIGRNTFEEHRPEIRFSISGRIRNAQSSDERYLRDRIAVFEYLRQHDFAFNDASSEVAWSLARVRNEPTFEAIQDALTTELDAVTISANGSRYFATRLNHKYVPEFSLYYSVAHFLSYICRYHPDEWLEMQRSQSDEYTLIREFLHVAEDKIPQLALNHLSHQTYEFPNK